MSTLSWPPRLVQTVIDGQPAAVAAMVDVDSPEHVTQCVVNAANTELGWRLDAPDFGVPSYALRSGGVDLDELRGCLERSVPQASAVVSQLDATPGSRDELIRVLIDEGA